MGASNEACLIPELGERPTSVFLHGSNRPLLNWVLYAILVRTDPKFVWTDVRFQGERLDPLDPLARSLVPESQLSVVRPEELKRTHPPTHQVSSYFHPDEDPDAVRRLSEFLGLPQHTQRVISHVDRVGRVPVLGLSNAHRLAGLYDFGHVHPTIRAILDSGVSLVMTWADAVPGESSAFDFVLGLEGAGPLDWADAELRCTLGISRGEVRAGRSQRLGEIPSIADELRQAGVSRRN